MGLLSIKEYREGKRVNRITEDQTNALEELAKQAQELGLYDNSPNPMIKDQRFSKLNEATEEDIMSIKGVGRKTCDVLLEFLNKNKFRNEEDLKKAGLNTRTINSINSWLDT